MSWYRRYGRWTWWAAVILFTGLEAIRTGLTWFKATPILIAIMFMTVAVVIGKRDHFAKDERTRGATTKALARVLW